MAFEKIIDKIVESERILILSHVNPDGDAVGAGLGLYLALNKLNERLTKEYESKEENYLFKVVRFVLQDSIPKNLEFLAGSEMIEKDENVQSKYDSDLVICVDAATDERIGSAKRHLEKAKFVINIDHHTSNTMYGDINHVEDISSTSEMIYKLIKEMDIEVTKEMGEALYTGLVNDTGNFAHSNVTPKTFAMASDLLEKGVDNSKIVREFFSNKDLPSLKLMGLALQEMVFNADKKFTYFYLSKDALEGVGGLKEHTEGIVNLINSYEKSEVSLFMREEIDGSIKGSMRSKHDADVNAIAKTFNGGGHVKAAGFTAIDLSVEEIVEKVLNKL